MVCQDNASCPGAFGDVRPYFFRCNGGEAVERFVQQKIGCFAVEDKFYLQITQFASRKMGDLVVADFEQEPVAKELLILLLWNIEFDRLRDGEIGRDKVVLGQISHHPRTVGCSFDHFPVYADKAPVAFQRPENNVQQSRFPASVMPEQGDNISWTATEIDVRQDGFLLEALYDTVDFQTSTHNRMIW